MLNVLLRIALVTFLFRSQKILVCYCKLFRLQNTSAGFFGTLS
jgi:hypothetical protein